MTKSPLKNITFLRETVDRESGEVTHLEREGKVPNEPNYIKLYIEGIMLYADCPSWQNKVLHALLKRVEYKTNEINLPNGQKTRIVEELGISMSSLNNAIATFVKRQLLIRTGMGVFIANPHLFGSGDWNTIRKLRLTVDFSPEGVTMHGDVERDQPVTTAQTEESLSSSIIGVNPVKLMEFLKNPANQTEAIALSSIGVFIGTAVASLNQLFQ